MLNEGTGTRGLLDSVAKELGCNYLSDLRGRDRCLSLYITLRKLPAERFSSYEWTDAAQYLTGETMPGGLTAAQTKKLLLRQLSKTRVPTADNGGGGAEPAGFRHGSPACLSYPKANQNREVILPSFSQPSSVKSVGGQGKGTEPSPS